MDAYSEVDLHTLETYLVDFTLSASRTRIFQQELSIFDKDICKEKPVCFICIQVDKTFKNRLTIQTIEVDPEFQRKGIARTVIKSLKNASVTVKRVAHVESVADEVMTKLLYSEDFCPTDGGYCYIWEPLHWSNWNLDVCQMQTIHQHEREPKYLSTIQDSKLNEAVSKLVHIWKECIPGMDLFTKNARWFVPETNLTKISNELKIPVKELEKYRVDRGCFQMSSMFAAKHTYCFVIHGLAISIGDIEIPLNHACLCTITKGKIFVFDLVRRDPLLMHGVVVRQDFERILVNICKDSYAGYSIIDGLNYLKQNCKDDSELSDVLNSMY